MTRTRAIAVAGLGVAARTIHPPGYAKLRAHPMKLEKMSSFEATVSAICYSVIRERCPPCSGMDFPNNRVVRFVLEQHARMPDYLRFPFRCLTLAFDWCGVLNRGRRFHRQTHEMRWLQIEVWCRSRLAICRDLMRLYQSLVVFDWYAETRSVRRATASFNASTVTSF